MTTYSAVFLNTPCVRIPIGNTEIEYVVTTARSSTSGQLAGVKYAAGVPKSSLSAMTYHGQQQRPDCSAAAAGAAAGAAAAGAGASIAGGGGAAGAGAGAGAVASIAGGAGCCCFGCAYLSYSLRAVVSRPVTTAQSCFCCCSRWCWWCRWCWCWSWRCCCFAYLVGAVLARVLNCSRGNSAAAAAGGGECQQAG